VRTYILLCCALLALPALADTVTLNDGTVVEGTIIEENDDSIVVKLKYGRATYQKREIKSIKKSAGDAALNPAAAAELRDVLVLKNGTEHRGLLVSDEGDVIFELILSGRAVSKALLTRSTFKREEVAEIRKLTDEQRQAVRKALENIETSAKQDVVAEQNIKIETCEWETKDRKKVPVKKVVLDNFIIESDADEAFLRKCAYRLGKVFGAYKQHFGVDRNQDLKIRVLLFNSMAEFYAAVGDGKKNPAFYRPADKLICAGCDVAGYEALIKEIRTYHKRLDLRMAELKRQINEIRVEIAAAGAKLRDQILKAGADGTPQAQAATERMKASQREAQLQIGAFEKEVTGVREEIAVCNRRNDQIFNDYTKEMLETMYHEGFHGFVDNFLFPVEQAQAVPRWLHEGLAQYFECARLEADRIILGQEDRARMAMLRKWNKAGVGLTLEQILTGEGKDYAVMDMRDVEHSTKHYLTAWCLTWILGEKQCLKKEPLYAFVKALAEKKPPLEALPLLSGMKNEELTQALAEKLKYSFGTDATKTERPAK
jgi:hypothetical protein